MILMKNALPETARCVASPRILPGLDLIRLFAAVHIVSGHFFEPYMLAEHWPSWLIVLLCSSASISTSLFFLLSGFVLGYSRAVRQQRQIPDSRPRRRFFMRCLRGVPLMVVTVTFAVPLAIIQELQNQYLMDAGLQVAQSWATSLWLLNPYMGFCPPLNWPAWAMSVFIPGYAIDAWGGTWISRRSSRALAVAIVILLLLSAGVYFLALSTQGFDGLGYPPRKYNVFETFLHVFPPLRIIEIIAGICLGLFVNGKYHEIEKLIQKLGGPGFVQCAIFLVLSMGLVFGCQANESFAFFSTHGLLTIPLVGFILACSMNNGLLFAVGSTKLGNQIPKLSIAIYLLHWPLFLYYQKFVEKYTAVEASMSMICIVIFFMVLFFMGYYLDNMLQRMSASIARKTMKIDMEE